MKNKEIRAMPTMLEIKKDETKEDEYIVEGKAISFNSPTVLFSDKDSEYREVITPEAINETTSMDDVVFLYDHEGRVLARTTNGTLEVSKQEDGVYIKADLSLTKAGRDLYEEIKVGLVTKMSFGFMVDDDKYDNLSEDGKDVIVRTVKSFSRIVDVSAVSIPAYNSTEISVRNFEDAKKDIEKIREREEEKRKLKEKQLELALRFKK